MRFKKAYLSYVEKTKYILGLYDPGPDGISLASSARPNIKKDLNLFFKMIIYSPGLYSIVSSLVTPHFVMEHADWSDKKKYGMFKAVYNDSMANWRTKTGTEVTLDTKHPAPGRTETLRQLMEKHYISR